MSLEDKSPAAGAVVFCGPAGFLPFTEKQLGVLSTKTDRDGRFVFDRMPASPRYRVRAVASMQFIDREFLYPDAVGQELRLRLRRVFYERIRFVDEAGAPVDVSGLDLKTGPGSILAGSHRPLDLSLSTRTLLRSLPASLDIGKNECVALYRNSDRYGRGGGKRVARDSGWVQPARRVGIPGYAPADVTPILRPLGHWPKSDTILLERIEGDTRVIYRVEFPEIAWPERWRIGARPPFVLELIRGGRTTPVTPSTNGFVGRAGEKFVIRQRHVGTIRHALTKVSDREYRVGLDYPSYGFVTLSVPQHSGELPDEIWVRTKVSPEIRGITLWPGHVRIGPLPTGEYSVVRAPYRGGLIGGSQDDAQVRGPILIGAGHLEYEWR